MRSAIAVLLMMVLGVNPCWAAEPSESTQPAGWGVQQLMQSLAQEKGAKRKFTERKYMSVLTEPLESSGTLIYVAPGRLEKHTLSPREESMVVEHGVVVRAGGLEQGGERDRIDRRAPQVAVHRERDNKVWIRKAPSSSRFPACCTAWSTLTCTWATVSPSSARGRLACSCCAPPASRASRI